MRKAMAAMALCVVGGAANATLTWGTTEVYDSTTGLDWAYLQPANFLSFDAFINRTDGKRLATAAEVSTLYADAGIVPLSGYSVGQQYPGDLLQLRATWGGATTYVNGPSVNVSFITAADNGAAGYVGQGLLLTSHGYWAATVDGDPQSYGPQYNQGPVYGAALVSSPGAVSAVPEPSSVALLVIGLVGVAGRRLRTLGRVTTLTFA